MIKNEEEPLVLCGTKSKIKHSYYSKEYLHSF